MNLLYRSFLFPHYDFYRFFFNLICINLFDGICIIRHTTCHFLILLRISCPLDVLRMILWLLRIIPIRSFFVFYCLWSFILYHYLLLFKSSSRVASSVFGRWGFSTFYEQALSDCLGVLFFACWSFYGCTYTTTIFRSF